MWCCLVDSIRFYKNRRVVLIGGCGLLFGRMGDKEKRVVWEFVWGGGVMKKVGEGILMGGGIWI